MNYQICESPFGAILLVSDGKALKRLAFMDVEEKSQISEDDRKHLDPVIEQTMIQLQQWFAGQREQFELPLDPDGTEFQKRVWKQLLEIPLGEIQTYGEIAKAINKPTGARAVGAANGKNPIALIIPCHRVNGANGKLTGYASGLERKKLIQDTEQSLKSKHAGRIDGTLYRPEQHH